MEVIRMKRLTLLLLVVGAGLLPSMSLGAAEYSWFRFSKAFISEHYKDGVAFGAVTANAWARAANVHTTKCGGNDGELHIGIFNTGLLDPSTPFSLPAGDDDQWGLVAELPDAGAGSGPDTLVAVKDEPLMFTGYLRVWNEGHDKGSVYASNPHHVLEIHPSWTLSALDGKTTFSRPDLIRPMTNYQGYGATKFKPVLATTQAEEWPLAYVDNEYLYVSLQRADNFYQLPVRVTSVKEIANGHEATVDVYSDEAFKTRRYEGLRCITTSGSAYDGRWKDGEQTYLLGFFSINLARALTSGKDATTETDAVHVPNALEFFVFGRPQRKAVATCQ
jgi:hypothetical protein